LRHPGTGRIIGRAARNDRLILGGEPFRMTTRTLGRAGALLIAVAIALSACGGATTPTAAPSATGGTSAITAPPPPTPTAAAATPTPATTPATTPDATFALPSFSLPSFALPSFDTSVLTQGLEKVDSYRITITVNGVEQYKGVVLTRPVRSRDIVVSGGTRIVVIGDEAWVAQGTEAFRAVPSTFATTLFAGFDITLMIGAFASPQWAQSSLDKGVEQKNGVNAHHFLIDSTTMVGGLSGIPPGGSINFWIADDGYLVAWEQKGIGAGETSIQVTGVNDPANKVDRPA
jgi:hypothetical protein